HEITTVFVTHDILEALLLGDRIAVLDRGRLAQVGTPAELLDRPANGYVANLMASPRRQLAAIGGLQTRPAGGSGLD
ncbi:MAG: sugar ABC transporter ATP-binding protein, partial [Proteobacteria bacterium]|nr:sugar ABC transporter ATP-binding protein [Pseudomonadota bacterium]